MLKLKLNYPAFLLEFTQKLLAVIWPVFKNVGKKSFLWLVAHT